MLPPCEEGCSRTFSLRFFARGGVGRHRLWCGHSGPQTTLQVRSQGGGGGFLWTYFNNFKTHVVAQSLRAKGLLSLLPLCQLCQQILCVFAARNNPSHVNNDAHAYLKPVVCPAGVCASMYVCLRVCWCAVSALAHV